MNEITRIEDNEPLPLVGVDRGEGDLVIVLPTGEMVKLEEASDSSLAHWLVRYRVLQDDLKEAKRLIDAECVRRADFNARSSLEVPEGGRIVVDSALDEEVWDTEKLQDTLQVMVDEKTISPAAAQAALKQVITVKPMASGINAIRKISKDAEARINACRDMQPRTRYARYKP